VAQRWVGTGLVATALWLLHNPGENEQRFRANPNTLPVHSEQASG
jgi:hypothetical protein